MALMDTVGNKVQDIGESVFGNITDDYLSNFDFSEEAIIRVLQEMGSGGFGILPGGALGALSGVSNTVSQATDFMSQVNNLASSTIKDILGINGTGDLGIMKVSNPTVTNAYSAEYVAKISKYDPISIPVDLTELTINLFEDLGVITNKYRAIQYSRNYFFIEKPELESERSGMYRSYIVWTRPDLNLVEVDKNGDLKVVNDMYPHSELLSLVSTDIPLYSELCLSGAKKSNIFPLLSNYTKEVSPPRISESVRDGVKNMYGTEMPLSGAPEYHNIDISVTFSDNARGDIAKLFNMIQEYKHFVNREEFPKRTEYIRYNAIDYAMSMYIITVDVDWNIVGFGVALNCIPLEAPSHFTQYKREGFTKQELLDEFTVTFRCKTYKPFRPLYFDYFNRLTEFNPNDLIDTKGEKFTLQAQTRVSSDSIIPANKKSVFSTDSQITTSWKKSTVGDSIFGFDLNAAMSGDISGLLKIDDFLGKAEKNYDVTTKQLNPTGTAVLKPSIYNANTDVLGKFSNPGVFEMLAKKPGVYRAWNASEPNRPIFRLGFSY